MAKNVNIPNVNFFGADEWIQTAFKPVVQKAADLTPVDGAPSAGEFRSDITNRAPIADDSNNLRSIAGVERVHVRGLNLKQDEFGPNGEQVYEADDKDPRIRFYGTPQIFTSTGGPYIRISTSDDAAEVVFYGTGLNALISLFGNAYQVNVSVDGGPPSAFFNTTPSSVLQGRNYAPNQIIPVTSGLSEGWHTLKIDVVSGNFNISGFEILNERSDLRTLPGSMFAGASKKTLTALSDNNYTPSGMTGGRGGRVVTYLDNEGAVQQAYTETDGTALFSGSSDHSNEEIIRSINWREFGANRGDDFSTVSGGGNTDRAFTLDDGTTTLVGDNIFERTFADESWLTVGVSGDDLIITFVGTGIDLTYAKRIAGTFDYQVDIDGVNVIGALPDPEGFGSLSTKYTRTIASGLPYGTHTVRFFAGGAAAAELNIQDFIIYGPKKPSIPSDAIELCDYNVMADFSFDSTLEMYPTNVGVLRKSSSRENVYVGSSWSVNVNVGAGGVDSTVAQTTNNSDYMERTFWGSGVVCICRNFINNDDDVLVTIDGTAATAANFPTATFSVTSGNGTSYNTSTGSWDQSASSDGDNTQLEISGLSLGLHTIRLTKNGSGTLRCDAFDVITPVHINMPGFKQGSMSLEDTRNFEAVAKDEFKEVDLSKAKALLNYDMGGNEIRSSMNVSAVVDLGAGKFRVHFEKPFKDKNYIAIATAQTEGAQVRYSESFANVLECWLTNNAGTLTDTTSFRLAVFGELADEEE